MNCSTALPQGIQRENNCGLAKKVKMAAPRPAGVVSPLLRAVVFPVVMALVGCTETTVDDLDTGAPQYVTPTASYNNSETVPLGSLTPTISALSPSEVATMTPKSITDSAEPTLNSTALITSSTTPGPSEITAEVPSLTPQSSATPSSNATNGTYAPVTESPVYTPNQTVVPSTHSSTQSQSTAFTNAPTASPSESSIPTATAVFVTGTPTPVPTEPLLIDGDGDGFYLNQDCDDGDDTIFPGAEELCDAKDNNCDGAIDEVLADDQDGDGSSICDGDCDDLSPLSSPLHSYEQLDGLDNDCDGSVDEWQEVIEAPFIRSGVVGEDVAWCGVTGGNAGDLDGDGFAEFVVGCPRESGEGGVVSVYYSGSGQLRPEEEPSVLDLSAGFAAVYSGFSLALNGDVNGDGNPDMAIGQPFFVDPTSLGAVRLVLGDGTRRTGSESLDNLAIRIEGLPFGGTGWGLAFADHDGDNLDDLFIGSPGGDAGAGVVSVLYGTEQSLPNNFSIWDDELETVERLFDTNVPYDGGFGTTVVNVGDLDGDGYDDIVSSAYTAYTEGDLGQECFECGAVQINYGGPRDTLGDSTHSAVIGGEQENSWFGHNVAPAGDINNDGLADFFVGAPLANYEGIEGGLVYVIYGSYSRLSGSRFVQDLGIQKGPIFTCPRNECQLGFLYTMTDLGDINGDDYSDFALGAIGYDHSSNGSKNQGGITSLFYGRVEGFNDYVSVVDADAVFVSTSAGDHLGSVQPLGDLDKDGFDDFLTGAFEAEVNGRVDAGQSYLFYGYGEGK